MGWRGRKGQSATEFALLLPCAFLLIGVTLEVGGLGVESIVAELAASRVARIARVFHDADVRAEAMAMFRPAAGLHRSAPDAPALPDRLPDRVLRGGDAPSPYCARQEGYFECGYPE